MNIKRFKQIYKKLKQNLKRRKRNFKSSKRQLTNEEKKQLELHKKQLNVIYRVKRFLDGIHKDITELHRFKITKKRVTIKSMVLLIGQYLQMNWKAILGLLESNTSKNSRVLIEDYQKERHLVFKQKRLQ